MTIDGSPCRPCFYLQGFLRHDAPRRVALRGDSPLHLQGRRRIGQEQEPPDGLRLPRFLDGHRGEILSYGEEEDAVGAQRRERSAGQVNNFVMFVPSTKSALGNVISSPPPLPIHPSLGPGFPPSVAAGESWSSASSGCGAERRDTPPTPWRR